MSRLFDHEEEFHAKDRKASRKERKRLQIADRSKYKKTDQSKKVVKVDEMLSRGRVIAITGEGIWVDHESDKILCTLKGVLKKEKTQAKNLVVAGDFVRFSDRVIAQVEKRHSTLSRTDISGKKEQLIAANVDQVIIFTSLVEPPFKPSLIDRYLIAAFKGNLHPIIAINKVDLLSKNPKEKKRFEEFLAAYEPLGFPIVSMSTKTGVGIEALRSLMKDKTSVLCGQSGVGKSSLLNAAFQMKRKIGSLAEKTAKGTHTTTTAELIPLPGSGYCIDTPGIRSFGIWNLSTDEVTDHFTDIAKIGKKCRFTNCTHTTEPSCAVLRALETGKIAPIRYESYRSLIDDATGGPDNRTKRKSDG